MLKKNKLEKILFLTVALVNESYYIAHGFIWHLWLLAGSK